MPIHLTSRRSFLKGVLGAGAGWALQGCGRANRSQSGAVPIRPAQWAFVSDTHIAENADRIEGGGNMSQRFRTILDDILATETPLDGMLINGDIAFNRGLPADYATLAGLLEPARRARLGLHLVLGNHDDRSNLLNAFLGNRSPNPPVPDRHVSAVQSGGVRLIMLDSLIRPNHTPGELGAEQLKWLAAELDKESGRPCLLFLHHFMRGENNALLDEQQLMEVILPRPQVKAVFQGHSHEYRFREVSGIHFVELPASGYAFNTREPIGWVRARLDQTGCELELRAIDGNRQLHAERRRLDWRTLSASSSAA